MNAQHLCRPSRSPAHATATITAGWLGKFETLRAKLGCQYRGPSCFGSPLITTGAAITSTGEPSRSAPAGAEARRRPSTGRPGSPRPPCPGPRSYPCAAAARSRLSRRRERASRPTRSSPHPTTLCRYSRPEVRHLPRPPAD